MLNIKKRLVLNPTSKKTNISHFALSKISPN